MSRGNNIGILFADEADNGLTHDFFASIIDNFKRACEAKNYDISFLNCNPYNSERKTYLEQVNQRNYAGVIIICIDYNNPEVTELLHSTVPIVTIDQEIDNITTIKSDNLQGIRELVNYLIEMGHKRIAYIAGDNNTVTNVRVQAFKETCLELGVDIPEEYIRYALYRDMQKTAFETEELLRLPTPPSCILFPDDYAAIGGMNILRARGLIIPEDISVAGYDGIHIVSQFQPRLTTVQQNTVEIGRTAAEKLIQYIENPDAKREESIVVKTNLEKGRTVGRVFH